MRSARISASEASVGLPPRGRQNCVVLSPIGITTFKNHYFRRWIVFFKKLFQKAISKSYFEKLLLRGRCLCFCKDNGPVFSWLFIFLSSLFIGFVSFRIDRGSFRINRALFRIDHALFRIKLGLFLVERVLLSSYFLPSSSSFCFIACISASISSFLRGSRKRAAG